MAEDTKAAVSAADAKAQAKAAKKKEAQRIMADAKEHYGALGNRWLMLICGMLCMAMISNLQYAWTLFADDVNAAMHPGATEVLADVTFAWSLFLMLESFLQPVGGAFIDRYGARPMFLAAGILVGIGWGCIGIAPNLFVLYLVYGLAGAGAAIIYGGSTSIAQRWFPDMRGLCAGLIAMSFGLGYELFIPFISATLDATGYQPAFIITGILQGVIICVCAMILRYPYDFELMRQEKEAARRAGEKKVIVLTENDFTTSEVLRTPQFWLIFSMFFAICTGGLSITSQAKQMGAAMLATSDPQVAELGKKAPIILTAVAAYGFGNGFGRPFWGWVSDIIGRYTSLFIAFGLNAIFLFIAPTVTQNFQGPGFVFITTAIMFTWGELYSLFPSLNTDLFGTAYSSTNYGFLYSAKGFSSLMGGAIATLIAAASGNWNIIFVMFGCFSLYACIMTLFVRRIPKPKHKVARTAVNG